MVRAVRKKVKVKPGGVVEIRSPELVPGSTVEVIVLQERTSRKVSGLVDLIGAGRGVYASEDEADAFIRKERDSWD
jgi:hypothetical protein